MKTLHQLQFDNSYARLPQAFYSRVRPTPDGELHLVSFNSEAARLIDLDPDEVHRSDFPEIAAGRKPLTGTEPIATVYAGHQFGAYAPQLGDGRAILLGEVVNGLGERWDFQLKGAGPTPYARGFDGRAVLRSTIREYLCGEAMHGLGFPTTRALCIVGSDAPVRRETVETGAILVRLSPSYVRFGTFEYFSYAGAHQDLKTLADYVIQRHYPHLMNLREGERYASLFAEAVVRTAWLMAKWQSVGFAHGVMNTDNMSILGLTLDYGPFGFMDAFVPDFIPNHSDYQGRYAFDRQPHVALWNLGCLAQALTPLADQEALKAGLNGYAQVYNSHYLDLMQTKLGLREARVEDEELIYGFLELIARSGADYTNAFRALNRFRQGDSNSHLRTRFKDRPAFETWAQRYAQRLASEGSIDAERGERMNRANPKYILRNYLAQLAINKATQEKDFSEVDRLLDLLRDPYAERPDREEYAAEPPEWGRHIELSCSS